MAIMKIRQFGDPVLRQKSQSVAKIDKKIKILVKDMAETMYEAKGMGLAAVQVGILDKVFVTDISGEGRELKAYVNPQLMESHGEVVDEEGCLSIPDLQVPVKRAEYVKIKAIDLETGKEVILEAKDLAARALQHELDHIEGKLIIDRAPEGDRLNILKELTLGIKKEGRTF